MRNVFENQLNLFGGLPSAENWRVENFSADACCPDVARRSLEQKYLPITEVTDKFNRRTVSYQLSKRDCVHRWLKYKEGFSAELVESLLREMGIVRGHTVLDPFIGSGTTALVAQMNGINSIGFDVMPMSGVAIAAKKNIAGYDLRELLRFSEYISSLKRPETYTKTINHINITVGAYPDETARDIQFFSDMMEDSRFSLETKNLGILCMLNALEKLSFTAKDGQYLRWDERSKKVIDGNKARLVAGRAPFRVVLNKGELPATRRVLLEGLQRTIQDIQYLQANPNLFKDNATIHFKQSSSLLELPLLESNSIDGVITSPPYCNRYDYTRIYALELAYLGMSEEDVRKTRQNLLSCTVENRPKMDFLRDYYTSIGRSETYAKTIAIIRENAALNEVLLALATRNHRGEINNKGVLNMVESYFVELAFIYHELYRVCKDNACVAFVNDNVRYAGEVIPVDYISTELAEQIGFSAQRIYTLRQQKGNSSQQMKKFGRVPLRKSIVLWKKA
jgi:site-specific DNA-methyltransferase (cytosine-N4-specific)